MGARPAATVKGTVHSALPFCPWEGTGPEPPVDSGTGASCHNRRPSTPTRGSPPPIRAPGLTRRTRKSNDEDHSRATTPKTRSGATTLPKGHDLRRRNQPHAKTNRFHPKTTDYPATPQKTAPPSAPDATKERRCGQTKPETHREGAEDKTTETGPERVGPDTRAERKGKSTTNKGLRHGCHLRHTTGPKTQVNVRPAFKGVPKDRHRPLGVSRVVSPTFGSGTKGRYRSSRGTTEGGAPDRPDSERVLSPRQPTTPTAS